jgi:hypothetical protein
MMPVQTFEQIVERFGLQEMRSGLDFQTTKSGDLATTRDGDLQMGNTRMNAMFRFVQRWRLSESTLVQLFGPMVSAAKRYEELIEEKNNKAHTFFEKPDLLHELNDGIVESQLLSSTLAGSLTVILNNLFQRLRSDLNASDDEWRNARPEFTGYSMGEAIAAAAANFRHYDEWACMKSPKDQALRSMTVLSSLLNVPALTQHGFPSIRTNVCAEMLMLISQGEIETLYERAIAYAKSLCKFK